MLDLILEVVGAVASAISKALEVYGKIVLQVAKAIATFASELGVTETKDPEELGDKVIQAEEEGITPENFETYREYVQAVDNFEPDAEKSKQISEEDKLIRAADVSAKALEEKYPDSNMEDLLKAGTKSQENIEFFTSERFGLIAKEIENSPELVDSLEKLLNGKEMEEKEYYELLDTLTSVEQKLNPEKTETEIGEYLRNLG